MYIWIYALWFAYMYSITSEEQFAHVGHPRWALRRGASIPQSFKIPGNYGVNISMGDNC